MVKMHNSSGKEFNVEYPEEYRLDRNDSKSEFLRKKIAGAHYIMDLHNSDEDYYLNNPEGWSRYIKALEGMRL